MNPKLITQLCRAVFVNLLLALALPAYAYRSDEQGKEGEATVTPQVSAGAMRVVSAEQLDVAGMAGKAGVKVEWDARLGTPLSIRGPNLGQRQNYSGGIGLTLKGGGAYEQDAIAVLDNLSRFFRIGDAGKEFAARQTEEDTLGFHHVRLAQRYQGLRVFGGDLIVHFDKSGQAYQVNGQYVPDIQVEVTPKIGVDQAVSAAQGDLAKAGKAEGTLEAKPTLVVFAQEAEPQLAFELTLLNDDPKTGPGRWRYWIDAGSGTVLLRYNDIKVACPTANGAHAVVTGSILTGEGGQSISVTGWRENTGAYYLNNTNRHWLVYNVATSGYPDYNTCANRATSDWGTSDRVEMSAARNFDLVQRYWTEVMGRNSFNNSGANARANVHEGTRYVNAYWDGIAFYFGDGDGVKANSLAVLDVCGHEYAHAVTDYSADLIYSYEAGALNESFSDIFGACVEFYSHPDGRALYPSRSPGTADWLCGEDCWLSSVALRDMRNPRNTATVGAGSEQPSRYRGTYWYSGSGDNGGVHINSGVQNFFFYLLSEGGSGNNDGIVYSVTGIGVTNAEQVASRALTVYCTPSTDYQAVRGAWISAALDLNTNWVSSVGAAWSAVGIGALSVAPDSVAFRGPVGGPFSPLTQTYSLFNRGALPMNWSLTQPQTWLSVSPTNGTIPPNGSNLVTLSLTAAANTLAMGIYSNNLVFSNSVETTLLTRAVRLLVGQPDYFTELFDASDNDLDFQSWTFTPDGSSSFYSVCREVVAEFPTDPAGGTTVTLSDDSYATVTLTGTNTVAIYNRRTNVFFIGSNGYLTMNSGDTTLSESLVNHFNRPRVSACFDDLNPSTGGTVSRKQTSDRVAVTFSNVREYGTTATVSFQIEMFYDGRICITYLGVGITDGLAGLSAGLGVPAGFAESDLTGYSICRPPDDLVVSPVAGLISQGYEGGPFTPTSATYTLANAGTNSLNWSATVTQPWVTAGLAGGTLAPGATTNVTVLINANALGLSNGNYAATVTLSNLTTGFVQTRGVSLRVLPIPGEILVLDSIPPTTNLQMPFGDVIVGRSRTEHITLTNTDTTYGLVISDISLAGGLYVEDFDDGLAQGWVPDIAANWQVLGGEYRAQTASDDFMTSRYDGQEWADLTVQMSCRRNGSSSSSAAVVLRATADFDESVGSGYVFQISADGSYGVWKQVSGVWSWLQAWSTSSAISTRTNVLAAVAQGNLLRFYINGTLVWTGADSELTSGRIGLMGYSSAAGPTTHYFDNVIVSEPQAGGTVGAQQHWYNEQPVTASERAWAPKVSLPEYPGQLDPAPPGGILLTDLSRTNGPWRLESLPSLPFTVPAQGALTFEVIYTPTATASNEATVVIECNDADEPVVEVQVTGQGIPDDLRVTPAADFVSQGAPGGPFSPSSTTYVLSNASPAAISWAARNSQTWVTVTPTNGTLAVGQSASVTVGLTAAANSLAAGQYADTLTFSNFTSGAVQRRMVALSVRPDFFTELFSAGDNDLDFQTWTFTPDGSAAFYSVCREVATNFPTDPAGGTTVSLSDDSYATVTLTGTNTVAIYNRRANVFYIGSNGYLTMNSGDTTLSESFASHFNRPRISACFDDLNPSTGGTVSRKQTSDRVAVTFASVREYGTTATVNFQIEMFYDGRIRITYLAVGITDGLAGLSAGLGVPVGFVESDLTSYGPCQPPDDLRVTPQTGFASLGAPGGPFAPPSADYALRNGGTNALNWVAIVTQPWATADPAGGGLAPASTTNVTILINTNAQALGYGTHTACVVFSNAVTGFAQARCVQLTIAQPTLSISDAAVSEGNTGLTDLLFQVGLMPPSTQTVTVAYATSNGTALAGSDYIATNGTLTFTPAQTNRTITVKVNGDTNAEPNETFFVTLSSPINAALSRAQATGTILADDVGPFFDDFEPNIDLLQWSAFGGAVGSTVLATNYGGSVSSPNSLWFGAGTETNRYAASRSLNTTEGGEVDFWLRIASGTSSTWETADLPAEGIVLEYSINSGASWTEISRYTNSLYTSWTHVTVDIPMAAQTANTQFRWRQLSNSGTGYDHWALDDVGALVGPRPPLITTHPASGTVPLGATATFGVGAWGSTPLSYQWQRYGTNLIESGRITGVASNVLTITSVQTNDAGLYSVLVTNLYGSALSSNATLTVQVPQPPSPPCCPIPTNGATLVSARTPLSWNNELTNQISMIDLGKTNLVPFTANTIGTSDRSVTVAMNSSCIVSSLGIKVQIGAPTVLTVTIRSVVGTTRGAVLATASTSVTAAPIGFVDVPIAFAFDAGQRYDLAFNVTGGWGSPSAHTMEFYDFDNPTLNPALGYDVGPFKVLDGASGGGYANSVMPHVRASGGVGPAQIGYTVYLGTNAPSMRVIATNLTATTCDPGLLNFDTTYYWQVVASNVVGSVTGAVWQFITALDEVRFASVNPSISEGGGSALVTVLRENPAGGPVSVHYATANGTAAAGSDYTAVSGTLDFPAGVMSTNFSVPILEDSLSENNETVLLLLSQVTPNVVLGANAVLRINDDDRITVAVFDDSRYVDTTSGGTSAESDNVQASLTNRGFAVVTFTNIVAAAAAHDVLLFPEQEVAALGPALTAADRSALSNLVARGGLMIVHGSGSGRDAQLVNTVLGTALASGSVGSSFNLMPAAVGTHFADDPATVPNLSLCTTWQTNSLPSGSKSIYESLNASVVAWVPFGTGKVILLGWDWYNAYPIGTADNGWLTVLESAVLERGPNTNPPAIWQQPVSQAVRPGTNVTFCVNATGSLPLSYQWRKDGTNLVNGGRIAGATSGCLTISSVVEADSGQYSAALTNAYGSAVSSNATLLVNPLDHFTWSAIASPQLVGTPFPVTITAQDEFNTVVSNFTGSIGLSGWSGSVAATLFNDNFEDGSFSDWTIGSAPAIRSVTNDTAAGGNYSFTIVGGSGHYNGIWHPLPNLTPNRIDFYVRARVANLAGGYLVLANATDGPTTTTANTAVFFLMNSAGNMGIVEGLAGEHMVPYVANRWYKISLLFNWGDRRVDYYVDDSMAFTNIPFRGNVSNLTIVHLYNYANTRAWWDEIEFSGGNLPSPVAITPTTSGNFANGVWNGNITVLEPATNMYLVATDSTGHRGTSTNFDTQPSPPIIVGQPTNQTVVVGGSATFCVTAIGTGPLHHFWSCNGTNIAGAIASCYTITNAQPSDSGSQFSCLVSNAYGIVTSSNAFLRVDRAPIADASATPGVVVSCSGVDARVVLDGSRSSDPDGDLLSYLWFRANSAIPLATGAVAVVSLPVGTHLISLVVSDGVASDTNSVAVAVLTTAQAVQRIIAIVHQSGLAHERPLMASLEAALASINRGNSISAVNQLQAFQAKVHVQVAPRNPALADTLFRAAQQVIDALEHCGAQLAVKLHSLERRPDGKMQFKFAGSTGWLQIVEASTNLVDWEMIGVLADDGDGWCEFEDTNATKFPGRFYRVKQMPR